MAVAMRDLSALKDERKEAAAIFRSSAKTIKTDKDKIAAQVGDALFTAMLLAYAQGLAMLQKASETRKMEIPMLDVVRIWRGGCIIRSSMLGLFTTAFKKQPTLANILLDKKIAALVKKKQKSLRKIVQLCAGANIPAAALMSSLAYLDAYTSERLPINLVQAQRDLFGAHTYQRVDREGSFHTEWNEG